MSVSEEHRQELSQRLNAIYAYRDRLEQYLSRLTAPAQRDLVRQELESYYIQARHLEVELNGPSAWDIQGIVRRYLESLWPTFLAFDWLNLPPSGSAPATFEPTRWLNFLKSSSALPLCSFSDDHSAPSSARHSLDSVVQDHSKVVLVGPSGSGKSASLRRLFNEIGSRWYAPVLPDAPARSLPLLISARRWRPGENNLLEFVQGEVREQGAVELAGLLPDLLKTHPLVLLLDDLDDLPGLKFDPLTGNSTDERLAAVARLSDQAVWSNVRCVVSSQRPLLGDDPAWSVVYLAELGSEQVTGYLRAYFEDDQPGQMLAGQLVKRLRADLDRPFYLPGLLAYLYQERNLPDGPAQLLKYTLQTRLEQGTAAGLKAAELESLLARAAFVLTSGNQWSGLTKDELAERLFRLGKREKAERLWRAAVAGGLLIEQGELISFTHRLVQEYFCAVYCLGQPFEGQLVVAAVGSAFRGVWPIWAALANENLTDKLLKLTGSHDRQTPLAAVRAIGYLGDQWAVGSLLRLLDEPDGRLRWAVMAILGELGDTQALPALQRLTHSPDEVVFEDGSTYNVKDGAAQAIRRIEQKA